jgi:hypothetical protein
MTSGSGNVCISARSVAIATSLAADWNVPGAQSVPLNFGDRKRPHISVAFANRRCFTSYRKPCHWTSGSWKRLHIREKLQSEAHLSYAAELEPGTL